MNYFIAKQTHEAKTKHKYRVTLQVQFIILMKGLKILNNSRVCMENMHLISNIYFDFILFFLHLIVLYKRSCQKKLPAAHHYQHQGKLPSPNCTIYQGTGLQHQRSKPLYLFCFHLSIIGYYNLHLRTIAGLYFRDSPYENLGTGTSISLELAIIHPTVSSWKFEEPSIVMQVNQIGASVDLHQVNGASLQEKTWETYPKPFLMKMFLYLKSDKKLK